MLVSKSFVQFLMSAEHPAPGESEVVEPTVNDEDAEKSVNDDASETAVGDQTEETVEAKNPEVQGEPGSQIGCRC